MITKFGYHFLLCNKNYVYLLKKMDKKLTHFGEAIQKK